MRVYEDSTVTGESTENRHFFFFPTMFSTVPKLNLMIRDSLKYFDLSSVVWTNLGPVPLSCFSNLPVIAFEKIEGKGENAFDCRK